MYKAILFDLEGTLTESGEGITKCVQYALEKLGKPESDLEKLKVFIGPPLMEQFMKYADMDGKIYEEENFQDRFLKLLYSTFTGRLKLKILTRPWV